MKAGTVALIGRPNVGKSTLVNNIIGTKVAITSPKPQTTRFPIEGLYQDERGQIIFIDTPGIFRKAKDAVSKKINKKVMEPFNPNFNKEVNVVLYIIDHTRRRDHEEARVLGIIRQLKQPKILVVNKIDVESPSFKEQYSFLFDEFDTVVEVSALEKKHIKTLLEEIFKLMPELEGDDTETMVDREQYPYPALNLDSYTFVAEIIREKVFLRTRKELPYTTTVVVDEITERHKKSTQSTGTQSTSTQSTSTQTTDKQTTPSAKNSVQSTNKQTTPSAKNFVQTDRDEEDEDTGTTYIKARILTTKEVYKRMLIGSGGRRIKEIGSMARKELELATGRKIFLDLTIEVDRHWPETLV